MLALFLAVGGVALGLFLGRRTRLRPEAPPPVGMLPGRRSSGPLNRRADRLVTHSAFTATIEQAVPAHLRGDVQASVDREEAEADLQFLDGFLRDVRDLTGAEEAVFWQWMESRDALGPAAWSTPETDRPAHFRMAEWGPLVQWSAEGDVVHCGGEGEHPFLVAAPVKTGEFLHGVLTVTKAAGIGIGREAARQWLPRHAARVAALLELMAVRREYGRSMRQSQALFGAVERIHSHTNSDSLVQNLCATAVEVTSATASALVRWRPDDHSGEVVFAYGPVGAEPPLPLGEESIVARACAEGLPIVLDDATHIGRGALFGPGERFSGAGSLAVIPVGRQGRAIGGLVIASEAPGSITHEEARNLGLLGAVAATALEIAWEAAEVSRRALTDGLTGLGNRRHFDEHLGRVLAETDRFGGTASLILVDLDHFKQVNDTYGHEAGDAVLRQAARILQEGVRTVDVCARYGGEELAILLPQTPASGAMELADRLRKRVEGHPIHHKGVEIRVTASFGVASYPELSRTRQGVFPAADAALYEAKAAGRNCVRVASRSSESKTS